MDRQAEWVLVAGGAGFIGSHLVDALLARGARVVALDSLLTGRRDNLAHLSREPRFEFVEADITEPLPRLPRFERVFNLACAASPPHYQADPIHTMLTSVVGTLRLLERARNDGARFLQASTSEVYGDPLVHPQPEAYWGNVNPTGPRACYDEESAPPRRWPSISSADRGWKSGSRASSTPTDPGCGPMTGASSRT